MTFFRSEDMCLCQLLLHTETAFDCLVELGYLGKVQFNNIYDAEHVANLKFTGNVQRCSELQQIIDFLETEIDDCGLKMTFYPDVDEENKPQETDLRMIETQLRDVEVHMKGVVANREVLKKRRQELVERYHVMKQCDSFLSVSNATSAVMAFTDSIIINLMNEQNKDVASITQLNFVAGTIPANRFAGFELMSYRLFRNKIIIKYSELETSVPDESEYQQEQQQKRTERQMQPRKYVFMLCYLGNNMQDKVHRLCQGFQVIKYDCPPSKSERIDICHRALNDVYDIDRILEETDMVRRHTLLLVSADLFIWKVNVKKMMMIYVLLNKLSIVDKVENQKYLLAECWIPTAQVNMVRKVLLMGAIRASQGEDKMLFPPLLTLKHSTKLKLEPPTYFSVNKVTRGFQKLIDSYGIAVYQELNPAPYTIITFPFLFSIMFGDVGHGTIMALFGLWMIRFETKFEKEKRIQKQNNEIWDILFAGRYIIALMGLFSIYSGLIYNDMLSKSLNLFGSHWRISMKESELYGLERREREVMLNPALKEVFSGTSYPFGMDPMWDVAGEAAITTFNSLKMKLAVILGVTQMMFGLILSAINFLHKRKMADFLLVFMPQVIFMTSIFCYLVFLIFYKWVAFGGDKKQPYSSDCAPSILIIFINMVLMKASDKPPPGCNSDMFPGQKIIQYILVFMAAICIPVLLAGKPLYLTRQQRNLRKIQSAAHKHEVGRNTLTSLRKSLLYHVEYEEVSAHALKPKLDKIEDIEAFDMSEVWIHSGIHCIESVLGSVSHTASYLRLWALSLAHDQLSTVLWNMVLRKALEINMSFFARSIMLVICFSVWAILTISILVIMEGLSAFLHTLRLHWVEFQSKFYEGSGEMFFPFRFERSTIKG